MKWHTEQRKISDLVPSENNPRQLTEKQYADLQASLQKFDLAEIPAVNTTGQILAGHMRLKVLTALGRGDEIIDVRVPDEELSPADCREYLIRSNKNTGEWNMDVLANFEIDDLKGWGFNDFDLGLTEEKKKDLKRKQKEEQQSNVKIKIIYIRPEDWINWKNQITNFFNEHEIPYEIME